MTLRKLTTVPMLVLALFAAGCSDDCVSGCEESNDCAESDLKIDDCDKFCEDARELAQKAGCEERFDDYWSCTADQDDVCKADPDACEKEKDALEKCEAQ
jgi:hypothetical protein